MCTLHTCCDNHCTNDAKLTFGLCINYGYLNPENCADGNFVLIAVTAELGKTTPHFPSQPPPAPASQLTIGNKPILPEKHRKMKYRTKCIGMSPTHVQDVPWCPDCRIRKLGSLEHPDIQTNSFESFMLSNARDERSKLLFFVRYFLYFDCCWHNLAVSTETPLHHHVTWEFTANSTVKS